MRGIAAAIEQQDYLAAILERLGHGHLQRPADRAAVAAIFEFQPQVDGHHIG